MTKKCFKCKRIKEIEQFYKHKQMGDGYLGKCKSCTKKDVNGRYSDPQSRLKIVEYERKRFKDPERKKKIYLYNLKRKLKRPKRHKAAYKVSNAIRDGKLKRLPCEVCGDVKSQGHHKDYRKPLNVTWLCFKHHREVHGQKVLLN